MMVATNHNTPEGMDRFYATASLGYFADRLPLWERVAALCDERTAGRDTLHVLEVGCGVGHFLRTLDERMGNRIATMTGIDYSQRGLEQARWVYQGAGYVCMDVTAPTQRFSADLIVCSQTLEHIAEASVALENMVSWLAPGGVLLVTVPDGARDTFAGHVHFWDEVALAALVARHGGTVGRLTDMNLWAEIRNQGDSA